MTEKKPHSKLWLYFTALVFATILIIFLLVSAVWLLLFEFGVLSVSPIERRAPIFLFSVGSLLLGVTIAMFVGKLIIVPIQNISNAFDELSKGNFSVKVSENERIAEIREISQRFNAMTFDLSHIETLRSDFVVNVSHEFKTPIAAIEGYTTLLQNPALSAERHEHYVAKILDNSRKLSTLSSNILMLSKLENRQTIPQYSEFRLDEQIRKAILRLENKWTEKQLDFDIDLPLQMYCGCEQLLEQVWSNILDNAIMHSPVGGTIHVSLSRRENALSVRIADHGSGMSEETIKHIFEKFYQGDSSRKSEGNGLGLALVKRILDLCGGAVEVESSPEKGAAFSVILPENL